jgi:hypothetical protein
MSPGALRLFDEEESFPKERCFNFIRTTKYLKQDPALLAQSIVTGVWMLPCFSLWSALAPCVLIPHIYLTRCATNNFLCYKFECFESSSAST